MTVEEVDWQDLFDEARVALPPTVAHHDNDLDDYLSEGWGTLDQLVAGAKPPKHFDAYEGVYEENEHGRHERDEKASSPSKIKAEDGVVSDRNET